MGRCQPSETFERRSYMRCRSKHGEKAQILGQVPHLQCHEGILGSHDSLHDNLIKTPKEQKVG